MTFQIRRADLPCSEADFAERVAAHVERLNEHARHLLGVEADKANPDLKDEDRRVAFPPPTDHPLVEAAIRPAGTNRDGFGHVADYEILGPSLDERKAALTADVHQREAALIGKLMPPGKQRHWQFRENDIRTADRMRLDNHPARIEPDQVDSWLRSMRPAEETAFLDDVEVRRYTLTAIQRWAAENEHDIDDLTEETIDGFEVTPFHG